MMLDSVWILFFFAVFMFWLWMLVDCLDKEFKGNEKIIWVLVIILLNVLGALIYYFVGRPQAVRE